MRKLITGKLITAYCLAAGSCDLLTGLLLVSAPHLTLGLMGIAVLPAEPIYLRFIGAFVGAVGAAYLYPFLLLQERQSRLAVVLEVTALVRLAVGTFVGVGVLIGALAPPWLTVSLTDLLLALVQLFLLSRLLFAHERHA